MNQFTLFFWQIRFLGTLCHAGLAPSKKKAAPQGAALFQFSRPGGSGAGGAGESSATPVRAARSFMSRLPCTLSGSRGADPVLGPRKR